MKVTSVQPGCKQCLSSPGLIWLSSMILHRHTDKWGSNLCSLTQLIIQPCKSQPAKSDTQASSNTQSFSTSLVRQHGHETMWWWWWCLHGHQFQEQSEGTHGEDQDTEAPECFHLVSSGQEEAPATRAWTHLSPAFWMKAFLKFIQFSSWLSSTMRILGSDKTSQIHFIFHQRCKNQGDSVQ